MTAVTDEEVEAAGYIIFGAADGTFSQEGADRVARRALEAAAAARPAPKSWPLDADERAALGRLPAPAVAQQQEISVVNYINEELATAGWSLPSQLEQQLARRITHESSATATKAFNLHTALARLLEHPEETEAARAALFDNRPLADWECPAPAAEGEIERLRAERDLWEARCVAAFWMIPDHVTVGELQDAAERAAALIKIERGLDARAAGAVEQKEPEGK